MTCPKCEERRKKEEKQLSCCEDRYKKLESHYQRVTMVLVVMTTIVGKEVFDKALEILSIVPESPLTDAVSFGESTPGLIARGRRGHASVLPPNPLASSWRKFRH